jgi:hypothetical protein
MHLESRRSARAGSNGSIGSLCKSLHSEPKKTAELLNSRHSQPPTKNISEVSAHAYSRAGKSESA